MLDRVTGLLAIAAVSLAAARELDFSLLGTLLLLGLDSFSLMFDLRSFFFAVDFGSLGGPHFNFFFGEDGTDSSIAFLFEELSFSF